MSARCDFGWRRDSMKKVMLGNEAVSEAVRLSRVEVVAAYPITPQTTIVERLSEYCSKGILKATFLPVESEHSAMTACIGASYTGARVFTATSSQGLAYMHEMLHWAAGARAPIVMVNVNRALAPPWNLNADQGDSLSQRDTGWLQFYCSSVQEILDTTIQAFKISERLLLPAMICFDAFTLSHTAEVVDVPEIREVDTFLPPRESPFKLDVEDPHVYCSGTELYINFRYKMQEAMDLGLSVIMDVGREFSETFGRSYGLVEEYLCQDAELILVASGAIASSTKEAVEHFRNRGMKVGVLRIRSFRPFPKKEAANQVRNAKKVAVIDRNISFGQGGIFASELQTALFQERLQLPVYTFVAGLGGKDLTIAQFEEMVETTFTAKAPEKCPYWIGVLP
jgi:pyruvate/2-oxoacid:ferredoxin oxidoreductase alpha subunit